MKPFLYALILSICMTLAPSAGRGAAPPKTPTVVFLSPISVTERPFWRLFCGFMQAAADNLGVELRIVSSDNRYQVLDNARAALAEEVPDYVIHTYQAKTTVDMLPLFERAGVKSIICNTQPVESEREEVGLPRGKYTQWLGLIFPDNREVGYLSARRLIGQGIAMGLTAPDGKLHMAYIGASNSISSAYTRRLGVEAAISEEPRVVVDRFIRADWMRDKARYKTERLLDMYPLARVYWAASDYMALGVLDAAEAKGLTPSVDFLTTGIGWTEEGIRAVREGRLAASYGGHFMEGARALILALDHYNGHDFAPLVQHSRMRCIDLGNLDAYLPILDQDNWKRIDFKPFTKTYNPDLAAYDFTPEAVLRQLAGK
ncbi:ABC transporter substrate-binding protein [Pseudodesulfovibrio karagichevae]|uniref:ABC transporter substrate-binding protein n=1 Tax=Pseudodesulfovibrio karagichevae TaxID=3239305 RepID=A0ABV4K3X4_9BACT